MNFILIFIIYLNILFLHFWFINSWSITIIWFIYIRWKLWNILNCVHILNLKNLLCLFNNLFSFKMLLIIGQILRLSYWFWFWIFSLRLITIWQIGGAILICNIKIFRIIKKFLIMKSTFFIIYHLLILNFCLSFYLIIFLKILFG